VKKILKGFTPPTEKLVTEVSKKAFYDFTTDLDEQEEK